MQPFVLLIRNSLLGKIGKVLHIRKLSPRFSQHYPKFLLIRFPLKQNGPYLLVVTTFPGIDLPEPLHYFPSVPSGNTFFVIGGLGYGHGGKKVDTVYKYEPGTGEWTLQPYSLTHGSSGFPAFIVNANVFDNA